MLNEAVAALREGVVEDADLLDAGAIFATGFAPFRGGPLQYAQSRGVSQIVERLTELSAALWRAVPAGCRLEPVYRGSVGRHCDSLGRILSHRVIAFSGKIIGLPHGVGEFPDG